MLKDILPVGVISEINSLAFSSAKRFQAASPTCHVTVIVEGISTIHKVEAEEVIPLTSTHTLRVKSYGLGSGGTYAINDGSPVPVENGESMVIGVYRGKKEVRSFRITGS